MIGAFTATRGRLGRLATIAGVALLAVPGSALAGEASVEGGIPRYDAVVGEDNGLTVAELPGPSPQLKTVVFRDLEPVTAGAGCTTLGSFAARCNIPIATTLVRANLGDIADSLAPDPVDPPSTTRFSSEGDDGSDRLIGTVNRDVLDGVDGHDTIRGGGGNDALEGARGNDDVSGGAGDDTLLGGPDQDMLDGGDGADVVEGGPGDDTLDGGDGDDTLEGGPGSFLGSSGKDEIVGGGGRDRMFGENADDVLNADDRAPGDLVDCGPGDDSAIVNLGDTVTGCETVTFR